MGVELRLFIFLSSVTAVDVVHFDMAFAMEHYYRLLFIELALRYIAGCCFNCVGPSRLLSGSDGWLSSKLSLDFRTLVARSHKATLSGGQRIKCTLGLKNIRILGLIVCYLPSYGTQIFNEALVGNRPQRIFGTL